MDSERTERRLAAILSADAVGYSRLMAEDEVATLQTLKTHRDAMIARIRQRGGRVVAVGTTTTRVLESAWSEDGLAPGAGETDLYIYPPYEFRAVDALLTNFHLPRTSLLVMVSAFAGLPC